MKINYWNIIFTSVMTALLGCLGYVLISISDLQRKDASRDATEFSTKDADRLRQDLTDIMTDIDLRISLMERDVEWIKVLQSPQSQTIPSQSAEANSDQPDPAPSVPSPTSDSPSTEESQKPIKYDLRRQDDPRRQNDQSDPRIE